MATRHGRSKPGARLRCDALEPRETPAAVTVVDYAGGFAGGDEFRGLPTRSTSDDLVLTDGPFQARAVWAPDRVHVGAFETSFVFRQDGEPGRLGDGFTFALTGNDEAIWQSGAGGAGLGYQGLADSVAIKFDLVDNAGEGGHSVGVYTGGAEPTMPAVRLDSTPIHLHSQHPIRADLAYDGAILTLTLTDTTSPDHTWTHAFAVDIPAAVGGPTAYVGFTAGTGELFARQAIDAWTYAEEAPAVPASRPPEITFPAAVYWVAQSTVALEAKAVDDGGEPGLTYAWEVVSSPDGTTRRLAPWHSEIRSRTMAVVDLNNGYGLYTFRLTVRDAEGQTVVSEVNYDSTTYVRRLDVTPAAATVVAGGTVPFTAVEYDPVGNRIEYPLAPGWSVVDGPGTIDEAGRYTAPAGASGTATIQAVLLQPGYRGMSYDYIGGRATVTIQPARPPVIYFLSAEYQGSNAIALQALVLDDGGPAAMTYTWEVVSLPAGAASPLTASATDPSAVTAHVDLAGLYTYRLTVRNAAGLTDTDEVRFTHLRPYVTSLEVSPQKTTVPAGGTVQLTAVVRDQFGNPMPDVRPEWEVLKQGPGTIDPSGLYTAPADVSGLVDFFATIQAGDPRYPYRLYADAQVQIVSTRPPVSGLDFAGGFVGADLARNGSAQLVGDRIRLTDSPFQAGSAYAPTPVDVRGFTTSFEFQVGDAADGRLGDGLTFVLQNAGPATLGAAGGGLGYAGVANSVAVKFDLVDNAGEGTDSVGVFTNGAAPTVPADPLPDWIIQLHSGHVFRVDVTYAGGVLTVGLRDGATGNGSSWRYAVDLPAAVGGSHAYAGFTAGTGELSAPIDILDWRFMPTDNWNPSPPPL